MRLSILSAATLGLLALAACDRAPEAEEKTAAGKAGSSMEAEPVAVPTGPISAGKALTSAAESPALVVEAEGLRLFNPKTGAARPISFGMPQAQVLAALEFRGPPGTGTNTECGAGALQYANWPDGLGLYFQDDKFAGWHADERGQSALPTASGIGPGSTRAELDAAYAATVSQTTLGTEFAAGKIFGLLDGKGRAAKIINMWGGVSCNFR